MFIYLQIIIDVNLCHLRQQEFTFFYINHCKKFLRKSLVYIFSIDNFPVLIYIYECTLTFFIGGDELCHSKPPPNILKVSEN